MRIRCAGVAACVLFLGMSPIASASASASAMPARSPNQTSATRVANITAQPSAIGTPGAAGGKCVLTSGQAFQPGSAWTCYVVLFDPNYDTPVQWTAVAPTSCGWQCKTTFSPSSGTLTDAAVWVKITTAIGNCAGYTLAFETSTTTKHLPVRCSGGSPPSHLIANPTSIGDHGDADGWCIVTSGQAYLGGIWTCYVALFSSSKSPIPWIATGPHCGSGCKISPSYGVAGAGGIWVKIMTVATGCEGYAVSFKNPGKTVKVPECWG